MRHGRLAAAPLALVVWTLGALGALGVGGCKHVPPAGSRDQIVTAIEVNGLKSVKTSELLAKLGTEKQPWYPFAAPRWYSPFVFRKDQERIVAFLRERKDITTQEFKELVGATRKHVIPLAEHFDREKVTIRVGERRTLRGGVRP